MNPLRLIGLLLMAGWLGGCSDGKAPPPAVKLADPGPVAAEEQRPGDPEAGYRALVNEAYVSCGIPYSAYRRLNPSAEPEHNLPGRQGRNRELPYDQTLHVTDGGVELVVANCLTCHADTFNGELIVGLGNETADITRDPVPAAESVGAYLTDPAEVREWRRWADRIQAIAPYLQTGTVGLNPAVTITGALFAHRDPETLAWSDEPLLPPPPTEPLPVSVPPWWHMSKKHALFYTTAGRGGHAGYMILASTLCTDSVDEARTIDAYAPDIRAYIASLQAPSWPFAVDRELADKGQPLFQQHCAGCHGSYTPPESYPNLVVPLEEIGTDPALADYMTGEYNQRYGQWLAQSFYGQLTRSEPARGYIAPPLDGVWATAPYLHNGSVPSIQALLDSEQRPRYWMRASWDGTDYDTRTLGWPYRTLDHGKAQADPERRRFIYDTTLPGHSNAGHTYGDTLSGEERTAVLEYLKTL